jgi:uncharacterized protein YqhQ
MRDGIGAWRPVVPGASGEERAWRDHLALKDGPAVSVIAAVAAIKIIGVFIFSVLPVFVGRFRRVTRSIPSPVPD